MLDLQVRRRPGPNCMTNLIVVFQDPKSEMRRDATFLSKLRFNGPQM